MGKLSPKSRAKRDRARIENECAKIIVDFKQYHEALCPDHLLYDDHDHVDVEAEIISTYAEHYWRRSCRLAIAILSEELWVPKGHPRHSDFKKLKSKSRSAKRLFGTHADLAARAKLAAELVPLEAAIRAYREAGGNLGHNAPHVLELDENRPPSIQPLEGAVRILRQELAIAEPSIERLKSASKTIRVWAAAWRWFREKADRAVNSLVDKAGAIAAVAIAATLFGCGDDVSDAAERANNAAKEWLQATCEPLVADNTPTKKVSP